MPTKFKIYVVTYQGHKRINKTLASILASDIVHHPFKVYVINNHSDIRMTEAHINHPNIKVLHNVLRPDWSSGHLSRNWNQALVNGFKSLTNPDCEYVVCSQDDSIFRPDWASKLIELHKKFTFVQNGLGDQFHSYMPEAVRHVGIWDERYCGLSHQAADYFWRCVMYNKAKSSIQDPGHRRVLNPIFPGNVPKSVGWLVDPDVRQLDGIWDNNLHNNASLAAKLIQHKFGKTAEPHGVFAWTPERLANPPKKTQSMNYITYPYFEKDIYDLEGKNYLYPKPGDWAFKS